MTIGYLSILVLRNKPSEVGLEDFVCINKQSVENNNIQDISFLSKSKQLFAYPFFISICFCYFIVQFIKTLFSDWAHIYMIKSLKLNNYDGNKLNSI